MIFSTMEKKACLPITPPGRLTSSSLMASNAFLAFSRPGIITVLLSSTVTTGAPSNMYPEESRKFKIMSDSCPALFDVV